MEEKTVSLDEQRERTMKIMFETENCIKEIDARIEVLRVKRKILEENLNEGISILTDIITLERERS